MVKKKKPAGLGNRAGHTKSSSKRDDFTVLEPLGTTDFVARYALSTGPTVHFAPKDSADVNPLVSVTTMPTGARNTFGIAVLASTVSEALPCPEFQFSPFEGYCISGLGGANPKGRPLGVFQVSAPSPDLRVRNATVGCKSQHGAFHMAHATSPTAPTITKGNTTHTQAERESCSGNLAGTITKGNTTHTQAELLLRASTHLNLALRELRQAPDHDAIQRATGRAVAAARALKQLAAGGAQ